MFSSGKVVSVGDRDWGVRDWGVIVALYQDRRKVGVQFDRETASCICVQD
jgi:hypothetical protein